MSQPADAQHRPASSEARVGNLLLVAGVGLYLVVLVVCWAVLGTDTEPGARVFAVLLAPVAFAILLLLLMQLAVLVGIISGTPWVSFSHGLSVMKRDWKTVVGIVLLLTVLCAALAAASV